MLFRNVPPALPIALAMTEGHEKAHRRRLMDQHGCTEMEAAQMVAHELNASRSKKVEKKTSKKTEQHHER